MMYAFTSLHMCCLQGTSGDGPVQGEQRLGLHGVAVALIGVFSLAQNEHAPGRAALHPLQVPLTHLPPPTSLRHFALEGRPVFTLRRTSVSHGLARSLEVVIYQ